MTNGDAVWDIDVLSIDELREPIDSTSKLTGPEGVRKRETEDE